MDKIYVSDLSQIKLGDEENVVITETLDDYISLNKNICNIEGVTDDINCSEISLGGLENEWERGIRGFHIHTRRKPESDKRKHILSLHYEREACSIDHIYVYDKKSCIVDLI